MLAVPIKDYKILTNILRRRCRSLQYRVYVTNSNTAAVAAATAVLIYGDNASLVY